MIPDSAWGALPQHPGPHRLLLLLWQFSGWRPGGDPPFAWPSVDTLACRLRVKARAVRDALAKLRELGYVREAQEVRVAAGRQDVREGWRLFDDPAEAAAFDAERAAVAQLDLFAGAPSTVYNSVDNEPAATDGRAQVGTERAQVGTDPCAGGHKIGPGAHDASLYGAGVELVSELVVSEGPADQADDDDDDVLRTWNAAEAERVRLLGGRPAQPDPPPEYIAAAQRWGPERLGRAAIDGIRLAADARARGRHVAPDLVAACTNARAWTPRRIEAIEARMESLGGVIACAAEDIPRSHAPPDPAVDGERVTHFELDAWHSGGADAVRAQRAAPTLTPGAAARMLRDGAPWLRIAGEGGP